VPYLYSPVCFAVTGRIFIIQAQTRLQCNKRSRNWFVPRFIFELVGKERDTAIRNGCKQTDPACGSCRSLHCDQARPGSGRACRAAWNKPIGNRWQARQLASEPRFEESNVYTPYLYQTDFVPCAEESVER